AGRRRRSSSPRASWGLLGGPALRDLRERSRVESVELVAAAPLGGYQPRALEHVEMLRDRLPARRDAVLHRQSAADLEQRLLVAIREFIEDRAAGAVAQCVEEVVHGSDDRQVMTCMSMPLGTP